MGNVSKSAPPQFISTHPSGPTRIHDIEVNLPKVRPLYDRAEKPAQRFGPPPKTGSGNSNSDSNR
jgi:predicted Zn-dependent protease